jgi:mannosyltransferase OCH1-like enzyme
MSKFFGIYKKVPLHIFQYYNNEITENHKNIQLLNPEFNIFIFNEGDCIKFILNNYPDYVYNAYNSLIPLKYKLDLWKYCILYKYGGIYIDANFICNTKLINFIDNNYYVSEMDYYYNRLSINSDFIISKVNNPLFLTVINTIISNINNNYYGISATYPTGSGLLGAIISKNKIKTELYYDNNNIYYNKHIIMKKTESKKNEYYKLLWLSKNIYKCQKILTL